MHPQAQNKDQLRLNEGFFGAFWGAFFWVPGGECVWVGDSIGLYERGFQGLALDLGFGGLVGKRSATWGCIPVHWSF